MTFEDKIKERYDALVELSNNFNIEVHNIKNFLVELMNAQEVIADGRTVYQPDYQPVLQAQEELLDQVTTDHVTLFEVIDKNTVEPEDNLIGDMRGKND